MTDRRTRVSKIPLETHLARMVIILVRATRTKHGPCARFEHALLAIGTR